MTELNTGVTESQVETNEEFIPKQELASLKGFVVYQFNVEETLESSLTNLTEDNLLGATFKPCGKYDAEKVGFSPFDGEDNNFLLNTLLTSLGI